MDEIKNTDFDAIDLQLLTLLQTDASRSNQALAAAVGILSACAGSASTGPVPEGYYRVQPGDNLYRIGLRFGQSVNTLARWNNLRDTSQIEVGQVLRVRSGSSSSSTKTTKNQ